MEKKHPAIIRVYDLLTAVCTTFFTVMYYCHYWLSYYLTLTNIKPNSQVKHYILAYVSDSNTLHMHIQTPTNVYQLTSTITSTLKVYEFKNGSRDR